jgi:hypothetical protein
MLNLLDLVQLENFFYPALSVNKTALSTDFEYLLAQSIQVDGDVVNTREHIREKTMMQP